ncbi:hypothetical protein GQX74_005796 [Glossina fuscipes]|nr:hypothetical protein GQX74_005796 [Glossina fuscipes]
MRSRSAVPFPTSIIPSTEHDGSRDAKLIKPVAPVSYVPCSGTNGITPTHGERNNKTINIPKSLRGQIFVPTDEIDDIVIYEGSLGTGSIPTEEEEVLLCSFTRGRDLKEYKTEKKHDAVPPPKVPLDNLMAGKLAGTGSNL